LIICRNRAVWADNNAAATGRKLVENLRQEVVATRQSRDAVVTGTAPPGDVAQADSRFLAAPGEMAERVRNFDWQSTPLGPLAEWPQSRRTAVGMMLLSAVPIVMLWGEDGIMIYNDAYSVFAGGRHPTLLGSKVRAGWPEVADFNDNVMRVVLGGGTLAYRDQELTLWRSGVPEPVWMNLDYSPILDESGKPAGVMAIVVETTERVRAEAALRFSEEQLRLATEAAEVGLWDVDVVTDTLYWPPRVKAMFGISPAVPVSMADFYAGLHPEDREATSAAYAAAADPSRRALYDVEYRTIGKEDGVIRWVAAKGRGVFDADGRCLRMIGTAIDVTGRKAIEQRLRELNETLERQVAERTAERDRVWRNSRDLLVLIGTDGIYRAVNPAWTTILGHAPGDVVGKSFLDFVAPEDAALAKTGLRGAMRHDLTDFETRHRHKDGTERWISWHTAVEGDLIYAYGRDVTAAKAQEAALAEAETALRQAQKMEAIGQLTGGIAHDFNNLLQSLVGTLDLIRSRPDDAARVGVWAEAGLTAARRGATLTGQLLAFSRSQKLELKPVDLSALLAGMRDLLGRALGPAIRIGIDLEAEGASVLCDATQLEMAVLNLAINARDAMPQGGDLRIAACPRTIANDPDLAGGDYVELAVRDSGTGMSPDIAAKAFDPFFTTKGVGKGTGLGLSQVYGMARQAGGIARIESKPLHGTTVRLFLRRVESAAAQPAADAAAETASAAASATLLVIDDDSDVRSFLVEATAALGYRVLEAKDGHDGLARLAAGSPDLVIVDYAMPGLTGTEVVRAARTKRPGLPIVFASGYADTAAIESVLDANTAVLRKPFKISELQDTIAALLGGSGGRPRR
jgi:PAS domain S-box-containing protein